MKVFEKICWETYSKFKPFKRESKEYKIRQEGIHEKIPLKTWVYHELRQISSASDIDWDGAVHCKIPKAAIHKDLELWKAMVLSKAGPNGTVRSAGKHQKQDRLLPAGQKNHY